MLSIDEGGTQLSLAGDQQCPPAYPDDPRRPETVCEQQVLGYSGIDSVVMDSIPVRMSFHADHPNLGGYYSDMQCDCDWWWRVTSESNRVGE